MQAYLWIGILILVIAIGIVVGAIVWTKKHSSSTTNPGFTASDVRTGDIMELTVVTGATGATNDSGYLTILSTTIKTDCWTNQLYSTVSAFTSIGTIDETLLDGGTSESTEIASVDVKVLVDGVEALIRWRHPEFGMISPARFIPVAEESGLIVPIGQWVLREACKQAVQWHKTTGVRISVAVNLSALQFKRDDLEQSGVIALEESGIAPQLLELELTESILISDTESVLATVKRLKMLGLQLSIDDFGTGYSSLSYLKRFEVDRLKIDQSFVRDLATDREDAAIVHAIIQMARSLGLTTVAEGVEDEAALTRLRDYGCDIAQGYFFARPMPAEELVHFLAKPAVTFKG